MRIHDVDFNEDGLRAFCERHGIRALALFGSILTDDFDEQSDVDFLVEFLPQRRVSLFDVGGMSAELKELIGREVDLKTSNELSPYFRDDVLAEARSLYAA